MTFMFVCICKGITEQNVRDAVDSGSQNIKLLKEQLAVGSQCGTCVTHAKQLINEQLAATATYYQVA